MADYNSSLPVRTETNGDVAVKIVDGTIVSQALLVNPDGSINVNTGASDANVNLHDGSGVAITSVVNGSQTALSTIDQADGPVAPGTAASFSQLAGGVYHTAPPTLTNGQQAALQVDSAGRLLVDAAVTFPYDTNYGDRKSVV